MSPTTKGGRKVALVTGGSRGIGRGIVLRLAREGYDVAFTYREEAEAARRTAEGVVSSGGRAFYRAVDAQRSEAAADFVSAAGEEFGRLDAVVANAGTTGSLGWDSPSPEEWRSIVETNLAGQYFLVRAAAPELKKSDGSAVLVASIAGLMAYPEEIVYGAAKAGTISLTRSLALALAPEVRVNAVAPGWVRTDMTAVLHEEPKTRAAVARRIPRGRWGEPEDVASAVLFLVSEGARFITGETLVVEEATFCPGGSGEGGRSTHRPADGQDSRAREPAGLGVTPCRRPLPLLGPCGPSRGVSRGWRECRRSPAYPPAPGARGRPARSRSERPSPRCGRGP